MFWDNFKEQCDIKGESPTRVCMALGLSISAVTKWKNGGSPSRVTLEKLSDYFGVPAKQLVGNETPRGLLFWQNFVEQCNRVQKSPTRVAGEMGFARGVVTKWKNGALPRPTVRKQIAAYFGVSEEVLLSSTPVEETLSPVKSALVSRIRDMSEEDAAKLSVIADMLLK